MQLQKQKSTIKYTTPYYFFIKEKERTKVKQYDIINTS